MSSRGYQRPNGSARELDMIDELDESNPLGVALHHGGPYEAIQKMVGSRTQAQQTAHTVSLIDLLPSPADLIICFLILAKPTAFNRSPRQRAVPL